MYALSCSRHGIDATVNAGALLVAAWDSGVHKASCDVDYDDDYLVALRIALQSTDSCIGVLMSSSLPDSVSKMAATFHAELEPSSLDRLEAARLSDPIRQIICRVRDWQGHASANAGIEPFLTPSHHPSEQIRSQACGPIALVGPSGVGKTTLSRLFASRQPGFRAIETDSLVFDGEGDNSQQIDRNGTAYYIRRSASAIPWASLTSTDVLDVGALSLLSRECRLAIKNSCSRVVALDSSEDSLIDRAFATTHDLGRNRDLDRDFYRSIMWLRRVLAASVADVVVSTDADIEESLGIILEAVTSRTEQEAPASDVYPEYASGDYYLKPSRLAMDYIESCPRPPSRVLDVGSGSGRNSLAVVMRWPQAVVSAVEPSRLGSLRLQRLARIDGCGPRVEALDSSIEKFLTEVGSCQFDLVLAMSTLSHLDRASLEWVVPEIVAHLIPGGQILVSVFTEDDPGSKGKAEEEVSPTAKYVRTYFRRGELAQLFGRQVAVDHYSEYVFRDTSHGPPHWHGVAEAIFTLRTK